MSSSTNNDNADDTSPFATAVSALQTSSSESELLASISSLVDLAPKHSPSCADDVAASSVPLHGALFHVGRGYLRLPTATTGNGGSSGNGSTNGNGSSVRRKRNVLTANVYFDGYLRTCADMGLVDDTVRKEHRLLNDLLEDFDDGGSHNNGNNGNNGNNNVGKLTAGQIREMKVARHERKVGIQNQIRKMEGMQKRRRRLEVQYDEELEGWDGDAVTRELEFARSVILVYCCLSLSCVCFYIDLSITWRLIAKQHILYCRLKLYVEESLDEMQSSKLELEMLDMAMRFEGVGNKNTNNTHNNEPPDARMIHSNRNNAATRHDGKNDNRPPQSSLQLTQITQDPVSGQLNFDKQQLVSGTLRSMGSLPTSSDGTTRIKRQQITEEVFRPSWNLPTMSLRELAEREKADAVSRSVSQREYEAERKESAPRRYEQLVRDGKEDDASLVEKSAALDREWDDWKEENPRGSGNKMGERGDRNF